MTDLYTQMAEITNRLNQLLHNANCRDQQFEQATINVPALAFDRFMIDAEHMTRLPRGDPHKIVDEVRLQGIKIVRVP